MNKIEKTIIAACNNQVFNGEAIESLEKELKVKIKLTYPNSQEMAREQYNKIGKIKDTDNTVMELNLINSGEVIHFVSYVLYK